MLSATHLVLFLYGKCLHNLLGYFLKHLKRYLPKEFTSSKTKTTSPPRHGTYLAFCLHKAQCQHLVGAGKCVHGKAGELNLNEWTPTLHLPPKPAVSLGSPSLGVHQMISKRKLWLS